MQLHSPSPTTYTPEVPSYNQYLQAGLKDESHCSLPTNESVLSFLYSAKVFAYPCMPFLHYAKWRSLSEVVTQ